MEAMMRARRSATEQIAGRVGAVIREAAKGALLGAVVAFLGLLGSSRFQPDALPARTEPGALTVGAPLFFALLGAVHGAGLDMRTTRVLGALSGAASVLLLGHGSLLDLGFMACVFALAGGLLAGLRAER
jgi:hypothetical protein